jgi:hypothetical protein
VVSAAPGTDGVVLTGASTLTIEDSLIAGVPEFGVRVDGSGVHKVANSTLRGNGKFAILLTGGSATVSGTQMLANGSGGFSAQLSTAATSASSISDSVISGGSDGIHMRTNTAGAVARVTVTRSTVERTSYALLSYIGGGGSASIAVSGSMIVNNNYGWYVEGSGAIIRSLGNNHFSDNTNTSGALTPVPQQ